MKSIAPLLLMFLAGCGSLDYQPYAGRQQNWRTESGTFVTVRNGIPIYCSGFPEKPYRILGTVSLVDQDPDVMAKVVRQHAGDAAMITDAEIIDMGTPLVPGQSFTFGGGNFLGNYGGHASGSHNNSSATFTTPSRVEKITKFTGNGYVLKFSDPVQARFEELQEAIEWMGAYPKGGTIGDGNQKVTFTEEQIRAAQKQLNENFTEWFKWCDDHRAGGTIPDGNGGIIRIEGYQIDLIRTKLQEQFQSFRQSYDPSKQ